MCFDFFRYRKERQRVEALNEIKDHVKDFHGFMSKLTNMTGVNITASINMKKIYDTLTSEQLMNLTLPKWSEEFFPEGRLLDGILLDYYINTYDDSITSSLSGEL